MQRYEISFRMLKKYFPSERSERGKCFSKRDFFTCEDMKFSRERFPGISLVFI